MDKPPKMRVVFLFAATLCVLAVFLPTLLYSCMTIDEQEWNTIKNSGIIEDILDFNAANNDSGLNGQINQKIKDMLSRENDPDRLFSLINKYPERTDDFKYRISEIALNAALDENTYESLGEYIEKFSGYSSNNHAHINQAQSAIDALRRIEQKITEDSDWADAFELYMTEDIILPLKNFADLYPDSEHIPEAREIISRMQNDSSYSEKYLRDDTTLDLLDEFIKNFPGHKDIKKAMELREKFIGGIYSFWEADYIRIAVAGDSITRSRIWIENRTDSRLIVIIPYGTYLAANSGNVQNMLIREEVEISVDSGKVINFYINTLCMNIYKDIPDSTSSFMIDMLGEDLPVINLLKILDENNSSYEVSQAAVWQILDNPGKDTILNTIIYQDGTDAITEEIYEEALRIIALITE